jgi:cell wall-associated NlpC family hydrolase
MTFTSTQRQKVVDFARAQVGKPYQWDAAGPNSYDCSGLVLAAWKQVGLILPHNSGQQVTAKSVRTVKYSLENRDAMEPGDLVFYYGDIAKPDSVSHVGLYSGIRLDPDYLNVHHRMVVAAVDTFYGVKEHWVYWALRPSGFGFVGH